MTDSPGLTRARVSPPRRRAPEGGGSRGGKRRLARSTTRGVLAGLACLFAALALYATLSGQSGRYVPDTRLEHSVAPQQNLERQAYLWDDARTIGTPMTPYFFSPATSAVEAAAADLGAPPWLIERLIHALYLLLAALGVILLLRAFRPVIGVEHAVAAFVYAFCPFTSQFLLPSSIFLCYALAPWFAWFAVRGVRDGDDPWRWAAALALALAATGAVNGAALGYALVPAGLAALYFAVVMPSGRRRMWRWLWRAALLSGLIFSAALVVQAFSGSGVSAALHTSELPGTVARTSSWSESWRGLGFWLSYFLDSSGHLLRPQTSAYFTQPLVIAATFLMPLGALLVLALGRWRHRLLFGAMLLISLVLMVGMHQVAGRSPFGGLLSFAFDHSELALGFRNTYKAGPGLMLALAVLSGVGAAWAIDATQESWARTRAGSREARIRLLPAVGVPALIAVALVVASFPFWSDRLYPDNGFRSIPRYWHRTFNYLGAQQQPSRVLLLPGVEEAQYRWGDVHDNLFEGLSPATPLINRALQQGTAESADLVSAIDEYVSSSAYAKGTLAPILARLGVRWVVLQNDLDWQRTDLPRPSIYDALRSDPGLRLTATFGHPGANTSSSGDPSAGYLGERALPPVEVYRVVGAPSPRPRLSRGPPLLVDGAGDSWPALARAGLLRGPPVAYTGAAGDTDLRDLLASGSQLVVTDGNRRRTTLAGTGRPTPSPTLAVGEPTDRAPNDLFGSDQTQSTTTYADADWISASRYGFPLNQTEESARPSNAFDGVGRTAWIVRGPLSPSGESLTVKLRRAQTITGISVLPEAAGAWRTAAVDVILHSEDGKQTETQLHFRRATPVRARARIKATQVTEVELRIARVSGPGPVGLSGVGISEVGVSTPHGPLDLRAFVRTPEDLADRAAEDGRLHAELAARPPRYELRRVTGIGGEQEETELRREITAFGNHEYRLGTTVRLDNQTGDSVIEGLSGAGVTAVGTSRSNGDLSGRGELAIDGDLATGWEPSPQVGERLDLRLPSTQVRSVEVFTASGPSHGIARSRVTALDVAAGDTRVHSALPVTPDCLQNGSPPGGCIERQAITVPPTETDHVSLTLAGLKRVDTPFGWAPPRVVEVRINGGDPSQFATPAAPECAPLMAVDGRPVPIRLPDDPRELLSGKLINLKACERIRLGPGRHRLESLPGLSSAVVTASLVPIGKRRPPPSATAPPGKVRLIERSPTRLKLSVDAPRGALLEGGMPFDKGWAANDGNLRRTPVPLDTFAAWRVEAPVAGQVTLSYGPQRIYELAMAVSIATAAWCLFRVARRRRRRSPE